MAKYKLTFSKDEIKSTVDKIKTKEDKIKYLTFLNDEFKKIYFNKKDLVTAKLIKEYKLLDQFMKNDKSNDKRIINEKFKKWLNCEIRPLVGGLLVNLHPDNDNSRFESEQAALNKKYPTYKFNADTIIFRCNKDYPEYAERITYLEFCLKKFKIHIRENSDWIYDSFDDTSFKNFAPKIQKEIKKLEKERILFDMLNNKSVNKPQKELKKFTWLGTEKSILLILELFHSSQFISNDDYDKRFAILRDSFLNKEGKTFKNEQLSVTRKRMDEKQEDELISIGDADYIKFTNLLKNLKKYIKN